MAQTIQLIPMAQLASIDNNRAHFAPDKLQSLADSIRENGLLQPIIVRPMPNVLPDGARPVAIVDGADLAGLKWAIVAGERRARAMALLAWDNAPAIVTDKTGAGAYLATLEENNNRENTNPMEQAAGYQTAIDRYGLTIDDLAHATGARADYIRRRLALLQLIEPARAMVANGDLGINYAMAMIDLDNNRQLIAIRALGKEPAPTLAWYRTICADLFSQQQQQSFDFGLFASGAGAGAMADDLRQQIADRMPADPNKFRIDLAMGLKSGLKAQIEKWADASEKWAGYGNTGKSAQCKQIVITLRAVYDAIRSAPAPGQLSLQDQIIRQLGENGPMTTAEVYQFTNSSKSAAGPVLDDLVADGAIVRTRAGRGWRYSLPD